MISSYLRNTNFRHTTDVHVRLLSYYLLVSCHNLPFIAASLIPFGGLFARNRLPPPECVLIVDAGFSYTHIVPIIHGEIIWNAVRRYGPHNSVLNQLILPKDRCWRETADQPAERACFLPTMEHDGRNVYHEWCEGSLLLCLTRL